MTQIRPNQWIRPGLRLWTGGGWLTLLLKGDEAEYSSFEPEPVIAEPVPAPVPVPEPEVWVEQLHTLNDPSQDGSGNQTAWSNTATTILVGSSTSSNRDSHIALRFTGLEIPRGSVIAEADVELNLSTSFSNSQVLVVESLLDKARTPEMVGGFEDLVERALTTAKGTQSFSEGPPANEYVSFDLKEALEERVAGAAARTLVVVLREQGRGAVLVGRLTFKAVEATTTLRPRLRLKFAPPETLLPDLPEDAEPEVAPTINAFTATPGTIDKGASSTLQWSLSGKVTSVSIDQGVGSVSTVSSQMVTPGNTTEYRLTAFNGTLSSSRTVIVTVIQPPPPPPPDVVATDFVSSSAADWSWRYGAGTRSVVSAGTLGGKALEYKVNSHGNNALGWMTGPNKANVEVLAKLRQRDSESAQTIGIGVRLGGTASNKVGYGLRHYNGELALMRYFNDGDSYINGYDGLPSRRSVSKGNDVWFWLRLRVVGNVLYASMWLDTAAEPTDWMLGGTNSLYPAAGPCGLRAYSSARTFQCDYFAVKQDQTLGGSKIVRP